MTDSTYVVKRLDHRDVKLMKELLDVYGDAFGDVHAYAGARPDDEYLAGLLAKPDFITIVSLDGTTVVGGLSAYVLQKFEQRRSEIYIYDLAVDERHRRKGIATSLIAELKVIGRTLGASVIFVQADPEDEPAIALYTGLGRREDVHHFDIDID